MNAPSWYSHIAIDPCATILPRRPSDKEEERVAAMGNSKWTPLGARKKGVNLRAAATVGFQSKAGVKVAWTSIFTRGKLRVYVCDASAASADTKSQKN